MQSANLVKKRNFFPAKLRRIGEDILHHQCWCWGQDIKHPSGNLLSHYGFIRHTPPDAAAGSTAYELRLLDKTQIILWGFGVFYGETGGRGVFLGRYKFTPQLTTSGRLQLPVWTPEQIERDDVDDSTSHRRFVVAALINLTRLAQAYEAWVEGIQGVQYRRDCLERFKISKLRDVSLAAEWEKLRQTWLLPHPAASPARSVGGA